MATLQNEKCVACGEDEIDGACFVGCDHKFCQECAKEIERPEELKCPLCPFLTSRPDFSDLPDEDQPAGKNTETEKETQIVDSADEERKEAEREERAANYELKERFLMVDEHYSRCEPCKKDRIFTMAEIKCVDCFLFLCNQDAKKPCELGGKHRLATWVKPQVARRGQVTAFCIPCLLDKTTIRAIHRCTDCWTDLCEGCSKGHNHAFKHHLVGIGAHLKPEEKANAFRLPPSRITGNYNKTCKTHNKHKSFGCTKCYFLVCKKCHKEKQSIEEECTSGDNIHVFKSLGVLEELVEKRVSTGMHYIQQYFEFAVELMESACDYQTPDVSSVVNKLDEKVQEVMGQGEGEGEMNETFETAKEYLSSDGESSNDSGQHNATDTI